MRAVTSATAAAVLKVEKKALDNVLSRLGEDLYPRGRQGVERRISIALLADLLLAYEIAKHLGTPLRDAVRAAHRLRHGETNFGSFLQIRANFEDLRAVLDRELEVAIEAVVRRPRGRPRRS